MNTPQAPRSALVTGGATRVGAVLSRGLAKAGYHVFVHYNSSDEAALTLAGEIRAAGGSCETVGGDLALPETSAQLAAVVAAATHGGSTPGLDLLVNNAATFDAHPLLAVDPERWDAVMDVNVRAPHLLVRALAPALRQARGSVVNILDLSAFQPWTEYPHHAVSKAALAHLTRIQARVLAPEVRVNAVAPGAVLPPDSFPDERVEALRERAALKKIGTPEDVLGAVLYFAGAPFVTGQILAVDGGRMLGPDALRAD